MKIRALALIAGIAMVGAIAGCGKDNGTAVVAGSCPAGHISTPNGCQLGGQTSNIPCPVGYVSTSQGCQPQNYNNCNHMPQPAFGQGYAFVNNQCVLGSLNNGTSQPMPSNPSVNQQQCSPGYIYTQQYGCQIQIQTTQCGNPQPGQGFAIVNGTCIPGTVSTVYNNNSNNVFPNGGSFQGGASWGWSFGAGVAQDPRCPYGGRYNNGWCFF